jgi:tRNA U34 5-methylaminomethyl-2-thiouridine-forming methyltransferase MnmC
MITIYETKDGSKTLLNTDLNETYHSRFGAIQESVHVFIKAGVLEYLQRYPESSSIHILEVGFGTGLNALLTLQALQNFPCKVYYETIETYPLSYQQVSALGYIELIGHDLEEKFERLHLATWNQPVEITPNFVLHKRNISLTTFESSQSFQVIYFDAFAPNVQPEMWTLEALYRATKHLTIDGFFVTYCAKGQLKRDLKALGFEVERLAGPPGKREMTRGTLKKFS